MTTIAYLDCFSGVSGDMLLGALVDAGVAPEALRAALAKLSLSGYHPDEAKTQGPARAPTRVRVVIEGAKQPHRRLPDILGLIERSALPNDDKERGAAVFRRLA